MAFWGKTTCILDVRLYICPCLIYFYVPAISWKQKQHKYFVKLDWGLFTVTV